MHYPAFGMGGTLIGGAIRSPTSVPAPTVPNAPTLATLVTGGQGEQLVATWTAGVSPPIVDSWTVLFDTVATFDSTPLTIIGIPAGTLTYTQSKNSPNATALPAGAGIFCIVFAVNGAGTSAGSNVLGPVTVAALSAATGLTPSSRGVGGITLSWSAVTNATSYKVGWATVTTAGPSSNYGANLQTLLPSTSTTIQGLTPSTNYFIRVFAQGSGEGTQSAEVQQTSGSAGSAEITPSVTVNGIANPTPGQITGRAPLLVHFDCSATTATTTTRPFHELYYLHGFGDDPAATWATTGNGKNSMYGPVAAHCYEAVGNYTHLLTVHDNAGNQDTQQVDITVTAWTTAETIVISQGTDFAGAPSASELVTTSSWATVVSKLANSKRVLLKRGETWSGVSLTTLSQTTVMLGAWGSGAAPILQTSSTGGAFRLTGTSVRMVDLTLDSPGASGNASSLEFFSQSASDLLFLRVNTTNARNYALASAGLYTTQYPNRVGFVECTASSNRYVGFINLDRCMVLGCDFAGIDPIESHVWRIHRDYLGVMADCRMQDSSSGGHVLKYAGPNFTAAGLQNGKYSELSNFTHNLFDDSAGVGVDGAWTCVIGPQNSITDERHRNIVFDGNVISSSNNTFIPLKLGGEDVTVRNNIIVRTGGAGDSGNSAAIWVAREGIEPQPLRVQVYGNTVYRADAGFTRGVRITSGATSTVAKNNLVYAPNEPTADAVLDSGTGSSVSNNVVATSNPFVVGSPVNPADFDVTGGSQASNAGVLVNGAIVAFDGITLRANPPDVGAFEV
jgi:hypothetical protein